ncbi:MATE family efflux transporter [Psychrilyobacter atlanticus]|uniref:MATE family efflux transporter n=1 Tax=Psychrilyobacter atlanticus TaxID=271091 RepID=UPI0004271568|nr:MATE family efflux transporter [Psychrilyobacter atlanticus]
MINRLESEPISKLLIEYSIPAILGMVVTVMYSVVDTMFIGHRLGTESLAGVAMVFPLSRVSNSISVLISAGGGVLISIALGEKNKDKVKKILGNQIFLTLTLCLVIIVSQVLFLPYFLKGHDNNLKMVEEAISYGRVFLFCSFFNTVTLSFNNAIRAQGYPKLVLLTAVASSLTNIVLDYIFIFPLNLGVRGAAIASLIASILPLWMIAYFMSKNNRLMRIKLKDLKFDFKIIKNILKLGAATAIIPFANGALIGIFNMKLIVLGGTTAVAVYGIYMTIHSVVLMISSGISAGVQPIISHNLGAEKYFRVSEAIKIAVKSGTLISLGIFFLIQLFPGLIIKSFITDSETIELGIEALRYGFILAPVMIMTIMISGVYRAMGDAKKAFTYNFLRKVIIIFPIIFILPNILGIKGIWLARPISDLIALTIMLPALLKTIKKLNSKVEISTLT